MKLRQILKNISALQSTTVFLLGSNFVLALGVVYFLVLADHTRERIVLVPPHLEEKAQIAWNNANAEYFKSFGLYIATMVGNLNPKNASFIVDSLAGYFDPIIYNEFRQQALMIVEDPILKAGNAVIAFQPSIVAYEDITGRVFVSGKLSTITNNVEKQKDVVYEMRMRIENGRPLIDHFTSYEGRTFHTLDWYQNTVRGNVNDLPDFIIEAIQKRREGK